MTTATIQKSTVEPTWTRNKVQEEASAALTGHLLVTTKLLTSAAPSVLSQWRQELAMLKVDQFRAQGVRTPIQLVRAWAEYETNLFGSQLRYWGDDKQAHVEYLQCACWSALEHLTGNQADQDAMSQGWAEITQILAREFGFTGQEKIGSEPGDACCTLTFTAKA